MAGWLILLLKILGFVPWEKLVAFVCNRLIEKADKYRLDPRIAGIRKTAARIHECASVTHSLIDAEAKHVKLVTDAVADGKITATEAGDIAGAAVEAWAKGASTADEFKAIWRED